MKHHSRLAWHSCMSVMMLSVMSGCAEMEKPSLRHALEHPFGTGAPFALGVSKEEVRADWGEPDQIFPRDADEMGVRKEEWVYLGEFPDVPFNVEYLSRDQHLVFTGEHLTSWWEAAPPPAEESASDLSAEPAAQTGAQAHEPTVASSTN